MTWRSRFKLFIGLIGVVVLVAGLTLVFNQRQSQVASTSASIQAELYPVGTDYGGTVLDRSVNEGDRVEAGDPLFTIQSPTLQADLAQGLVKPESVGYSVTADGRISLTAAVSGTVSELTTEPGSFVQAGQVLANIDRAGSLFVTAEYMLTPRDYSRIQDGASVQITLPDQKRLSGTVSSIEVQTADGEAKTTVRVVSDGLTDRSEDELMVRGTPVTAALLLRDDGVLAGIGDGVFDFTQKIGF